MNEYKYVWQGTKISDNSIITGNSSTINNLDIIEAEVFALNELQTTKFLEYYRDISIIAIELIPTV